MYKNKKQYESFFPLSEEERRIDEAHGIKRNPKMGCAIVSVSTILFWLMVGFLIFGCESEYTFRADCETGEVQKDMVCTMEVDLQCGCNGTTYINPCHATRQGIKRIKPLNDNEECKPW